MGLASNVVELSSYMNEWNKLFEKEKKILSELLGDNVKEIIHVGSTSIPYIECAKPVIDIAVGVENSEKLQDVKKILVEKGNYHNPNAGDSDRLYFAKGKRNDRIYNIHVEILGGESWRNHIVFRRKLLNHPEWVKQYCDLKRELALKYPDDRLKYTEGKAQFIKSVLNSDE